MLATPTVLVVEDDQLIADVIQMTLELEGYRVLLAARGETALELAHAEHPDVITLDLRLPDVDGHYLLEALQPDADAATPAIPVIVISGGHYRPSPTDQVVGVLPKPFTIAELQELVHGVLASDGHAVQPGRAVTA
jgi:DNA-binding response OmpR family regulator